MRTTTEAPRSFAKSDGLGSNASASAAAGMICSTSARSPPTARVRLARSDVVATRRSSCAPAGCPIHGIASQARTLAQRRKACGLRFSFREAVRSASALRNEDALGQETVHVFLRVGDGADAAIHRHACKSIGVKSADLLLILDQLDHAHGRSNHGLVQIDVFGVRDKILCVLLYRTLHVFTPSGGLWIQAVNALFDNDHLADAAV